jgi:hypothetical protein
VRCVRSVAGIGVWWRVCAGGMSAARSSWGAGAPPSWWPGRGHGGLRAAGFPVGIVGA